MRTSPDYTALNRRAMAPADDDQLPVWQRDTATGRHSQRWVSRKEADQRLFSFVDSSIAKQVQPILEQQALLIAELQARKQMVSLPDVTVTANQLLNLAGERTSRTCPAPG